VTTPSDARPQPLGPQTWLSFLPHFCQKRDGSIVSVTPDVMNPGFLTATGAIEDSGLQGILRDVLSPHQDLLNQLRFALVDLTEDPDRPKFAGSKGAGGDPKGPQGYARQGGCGSMAKLACMHAAFQMKFDLEQLAKQGNITSQKDLFAQLGTKDGAWGKTQKLDKGNVTTLFAGKPKVELYGQRVVVGGNAQLLDIPHAHSSPDLEHIFADQASVARLTFKGGDPNPPILGLGPVPFRYATPMTDTRPDSTADIEDYIQNGGEHGNINLVRPLTFAERMSLMIDRSDNPAAATCIANISFWYIASCLWQNGIYSPDRGGGLWLGGNYMGNKWKMPPFPLKQDNPDADFINATPLSVVTFLTLLAQNRLVNGEASNMMCHIMSKIPDRLSNGDLFKDKYGKPAMDPKDRISLNRISARSFFLEGLFLTPDGNQRKPNPSLPVALHSKIGIGDAFNDCALVYRYEQGKFLRYAVAGFDARGRPTNLRLLMDLLDQCIQKNNGL
jgi:hypothetical protein